MTSGPQARSDPAAGPTGPASPGLQLRPAMLQRPSSPAGYRVRGGGGTRQRSQRQGSTAEVARSERGRIDHARPASAGRRAAPPAPAREGGQIDEGRDSKVVVAFPVGALADPEWIARRGARYGTAHLDRDRARPVAAPGDRIIRPPGVERRRREEDQYGDEGHREGLRVRPAHLSLSRHSTAVGVLFGANFRGRSACLRRLAARGGCRMRKSRTFH
jgi:hypothetical protein